MHRHIRCATVGGQKACKRGGEASYIFLTEFGYHEGCADSRFATFHCLHVNTIQKPKKTSFGIECYRSEYSDRAQASGDAKETCFCRWRGLAPRFARSVIETIGASIDALSHASLLPPPDVSLWVEY
jgi:hypothetical protein